MSGSEGERAVATAAMTEWDRDVSWRAEVLSSVAKGFAQMRDATAFAATHLGPDRLTPLVVASAALMSALNSVERATATMPDPVSGAMISGAVSKLRLACGLATGLDADLLAQDATLVDSFVEQFVLGCDVWSKANDEILVAMGEAPIGNDY